MNDLKKMRTCIYLLPDPGSEVVRELIDEVERLRQDMEIAWGIIANAYGGDWDKVQPGWKKAAERWRDEAWHRIASEVHVSREDQVRQGIADGTPLHQIEDALDQEENRKAQTRREMGK